MPTAISRGIGGSTFATIAESAVVTAISAPTATDSTFIIPANTLRAGSVLKIYAVCRSIAVNGGDTIQYSLRVGGVVMVDSTAANLGGNNRLLLWGQTVFRAVPSAASAGSAFYQSRDNIGGAVTSGPAAGAVLTYATNGAITVDVLVTQSANNAGNQSVVESLTVEIL